MLIKLAELVSTRIGIHALLLLLARQIGLGILGFLKQRPKLTSESSGPLAFRVCSCQVYRLLCPSSNCNLQASLEQASAECTQQYAAQIIRRTHISRTHDTIRYPKLRDLQPALLT